jgi:hypothetical protein
MLLKLNLYEFKLEFYNCRILNINPIVTTKKIAIEYTHKNISLTKKKKNRRVYAQNEMRMEFKHAVKKST